MALLNLLFHHDYFSSLKSSLRITKLERRLTSSHETIKLLRPPSITENLHAPMGCGTVWGLIRLILTSFWFVMIRSTGASRFPPTQGVCLMTCTYWCSDVSASFFHTAFTNSHGQKGGVAFGEKVHEIHDKRRISIGLRYVFSFPGPVVNTEADLNVKYIYFKCVLGVQFVNSCTLVLVISSYFFSLSLKFARHCWHHCKRNEHLSQTKLFILIGPINCV